MKNQAAPLSQKFIAYNFSTLLIVAGLLTAGLNFYLLPHQVVQAASPCSTASSTHPSFESNGTSFLSATLPSVLNQIQAPSGVLYICGNEAVFPQYSLFTYNDLKSAYFDQKSFVSPAMKKSPLVGDQTQSSPTSPINLAANDSSYWIQKGGTPPNDHGNLVIDNSSGGIAVTNSGVVYIDGNLDIRQDIINNNPQTGLIFVVKGDVWVAASVARIDAFIIVHGRFCSAYLTANVCPLTPVDTNQLEVNGSLIYMNNSPTANGKPDFVRSIAPDNILPGEKFDYQPRYFAAAKNLFAKTRFIWTEPTENLMTTAPAPIPTPTP